MKGRSLLLKLADKGITVKHEAGKLKFFGDVAALTPQDKSDIVAAKQDIIDFLISMTQSKPAITKADTPQPKLSFAQQRLVFIDSLQGQSSEYNMPTAFDIKGQVDIDLLTRVFTTIIERHEILRTCYPRQKGETQQQVIDMAEIAFAIEITDLRHLTREMAEQNTTEKVQKAVAQPFDLSADLMLRVHYIHQADGQGVLLFNMHHIASDGWSMEVLTKEFFALYSAYSNDQANPLPPLSIQYSDYGHWQRTHLEGEVLQSQLNYWSEQLDDAPPLHSLPLDFARPEQKQYVGAKVSGQLPADTAKGLLALAKAHQLTPFMLLHGALALLLSRHSNQTDIVIGTPVANRLQSQLEPLIGFFVNTLVLRANTNHGSIDDYLSHIRQLHLEAQSNQDVPFEQLVERLNVPRSMAHSPIFQIVMTTSTDYGVDGRTDVAAFNLPGLECKPYELGSEQAKFDLNVDLNISEQGVGLSWVYDVSLFTQAHIEQLNAHLTKLLSSLSVLKDSSADIRQLPMLSAKEQEQLVVTLNDSSQPLAEGVCIHHLIEAQAKAHPTKTAVVFNEDSLSYQMLDERANQFARYLQAHYTIAQDTLIGLCVERSLDMVVAIVGILKAGAAYVPVDAGYPQERIDFILSDTQTPVVLVQTSTQSKLQTFNGSVLTIDGLALSATHLCSDYDCAPIADKTVSADALAYVIYTSGSTGTPKGVEVEHRGVVAFLTQPNYADVALSDKVASLSSFAFDGFIYDLCFSLSNGLSLYLYDKTLVLQLEQLILRLRQDGINNFFTTTALFNLLVVNDAFSGSSVKQVLFGGERCDENAINKFKAQYPEISLVHVYGPTESIVYAACCELNHISGCAPIGKPLNNNSLLILDQFGNLAPQGALGELYVGGQSLARGYLKRPELNAERFVANPFYLPGHVGSSERLYRTGDLVRMLADGNIEFVGRTDDQVKIRGFRIELGEVANQLAQLASIDSALAMVKPLAGSNQLVAYIIAAEAVEPQNQASFVRQVISDLKARMPEYMVPSALMIIDRWPLTANGKIDQRALPEIDVTALEGEYVAPQGDTEVVLAEIWAALLSVAFDKVSATNNFFELGGHSLLSMRLVAAISERFEVELPIQAVFDSRSLADMARVIEQAGKSDKLPAIVKAPRDSNKFPLSTAQQRLWFIDRLHGASPQYNVPMAFDVKGDLPLPLLKAALTTIIERHEILRSVYLQEDDGSVQLIRAIEDVHFDIAFTDLTGLSGEALTLEVNALVEADITKAFDLTQDLMLRVGYIKTGDSLGVLLFNMHHIASDGWSMEVLTKELFALVDAYQQGKANPLPQLSLQYADFALWQQAFVSSSALTEQLDYWLGQLADLPTVHSLPLDKPRPDIKAAKAQMLSATLDSSIAQKLNVLAKTHQVTPFMLLHGALSLLLSRHSNSNDIVVGTPVAGRARRELAPLIGVFINNLVLRVDTKQGLLSHLLAHIKQVHVDAQSNQDVPFEQLVERLQVPRSASFTPLYQIQLTTGNDFGVDGNNNIEALNLAGALCSPYQGQAVQIKTDLNVDLTLNDSGVVLNWTYDVSLFNHEHIAQLNAHLCRLLEGLSQVKGDIELAALPMLSEAEVKHLLFELNDTTVAYDKQGMMHRLFERNAKAHPQHIAVSFEGKTLSYEALNQKANQLAHYLREHHQVKPDTMVGLCVERSLEMVIAIMAILKAGGAYVPLDPSYPKERLSYMLEDAAMAVVLSQTEVAQVLSDFNGTVLLLNGLAESDNHFCHHCDSRDLEIATLSARNLAYMIYTSGSTGNPKGVMVEHQALYNRIHWMHNTYGMSASDKVLQKTPYSFDVSVWEFVWTLGYGAQLVVAKPEGHKDPEYLCALIQSEGITKAHFVPSMLGVILECEQFKHCHSIEQVFCSGEALQQGQVSGYRQALPKAQLHNLYGPTEAAIDVSYWDCSGDISKGVPIGKPIDNIQLVILDAELNLVPKGAVGELHIAGDGLARGYHNRLEMTDERFIINPYYEQGRANSSKRLYKTGDLARLRPDNEIEYQGRTDFQVKIRGLRIELGEVEHQIGSCHGVDSALVLAKSLAGSTQLVAYVKPAAKVDEAQRADVIGAIKAQLSVNLPEHMVPGIIMLVSEWPTTPNGKVDRQALPEPDWSAVQGEYVAPQGHHAQFLAECWAQLLGIEADSISATANFFELGGHSLMGLKLVTRLRKEQLSLNISDVLESRTLAEMAERIGHSQNVEASVSAIPLGCEYITPEMLDLVSLSQKELEGLSAQVRGGAANIQDIYPLSPLQQGIFYQSLVHQDIDRYITYQTFNIEGEQAYQNFINSFEHLLAQHDILRTSFHWEQLSQPVQVVERDVALPLVVLEPSVDHQAVVKARLQSREFKFDIAKAPMVNLTVCQQKDSDHYCLGIEFHHLVDDNIAIGIFVSQLEQTMQGNAVIVPPHKQYRNYIARVNNTSLQQAKAFFERNLGDIDEMSFIFDIKAQQQIDCEKQQLDATRLSALKQLAKANNVGLPTLIHTAWAMVIAATSGKEQVVFGTVLSGRMGNAPGMEDMVGPLINTLPLAVDLSAASQASVLATTEANLKQLVKYDYMPLTEAKSCCRFQVSGEIFNAIVNYRYVADKQQIGVIEGVEANELMHYPFALSVDDGNSQMLLSIFAPPAIGTVRMFDYLYGAIDALIGSEDTLKIALPNSEVEQLLYGISPGQMDYPKDKLIHQLIEAQVDRVPDAIAVVLDDKTLTYAELNAKANRLANYLRAEQQLQPQQLVGICVERSLEMVVGILAILKAGGAYVPIEPSYPEERIEHILNDADLTVVLMHNAVKDKVNFGQRALVNLEADDFSGYDQHNLTPATTDTQVLAYAIYTSGSTGLPKGVLIEHQSLVYSTLCRFDTYPELSSFLLLSNMSFDSSVAGLFSTLCSGAKLCLVNEQGKNNVAYIVQQLQAQQVSHFLMVPSFYDIILSQLEGVSLPALRGVTVAGEDCGDNVVAKHHQVFAAQNVTLFNEYGPTEGTVWATVATLTQGEPVTIGKAIKGKRLLVMNDNALVPYGAIGELYIGGEGLARGYLNQPKLTAERFVANPYFDPSRADSTERLYRTGDLVRYLDNGELAFLGRSDSQVKIRGFRIELGEVQSALLKLAGVDSAIVMAQDFAGSTQLVGYLKTHKVLAEQDIPGFVSQHKASLLRQLPDYMVPTVLMVVADWPLTPNGKIDNKALPKPDNSLLQGQYVAPQNDTEKQLVEIWAELLQFEPNTISATANFFELGGNSLLSIRLISHISQRFDVNIDMEKAFLMSSLRELGGHIDELKSIDKVQLDEEYQLQSDELELTL